MSIPTNENGRKSSDTRIPTELYEQVERVIRQRIQGELGGEIVSDVERQIKDIVKLKVDEGIGDLIGNIRKEIYFEIEQKRRKEQKPPKKKKEEEFLRFNLNVRIQHIILFVSVLTLIMTGLPIKFHETVWAAFIFQLLGGIGVSRIIHRVAAALLIGVGVYHLFYTFLTRSGRRDFVELLPKFKDFSDFYKMIRYFLGFSSQKPKFCRFSYIEKFDYWAVYWGMVIMIGSGALLWFEELSLKFLPKFVLDIAKEAHSDEALLATLAIIIWHFYNVHLNPSRFPMSWTWWTGKISHTEMLNDHPLEYGKIIGESSQSEETFEQ